MLSTNYTTKLLMRAAEPELKAIMSTTELLGSAMRSIDHVGADAANAGAHVGNAVRDVAAARQILLDQAEVLDVAAPLRRINGIDWPSLERAVSTPTFSQGDPAVAQAVDGVSDVIFDSMLDVANMSTSFLDDIRATAGRISAG